MEGDVAACADEVDDRPFDPAADPQGDCRLMSAGEGCLGLIHNNDTQLTEDDPLPSSCADLNIIDQILAMAFSRMPRLDMATDAGHLQVGVMTGEKIKREIFSFELTTTDCSSPPQPRLSMRDIAPRERHG